MSTPAKSFLDCVKQAVSSTKQLLDDGEKLIEVNFLLCHWSIWTILRPQHVI